MHRESSSCLPQRAFAAICPEHPRANCYQEGAHTMTSSSDTARQYSRAHAEQFRHELHDLLRIPSLSGAPAHAGDIQRAAEWLVTHLRDLGIENARIIPTAGHPVVYGEWLGAGPDKPTVLVYGHYDVVPA